MIVHFFEVWLLVLMTFIIGCVLGAFLYGILADSGLAIVQGSVADGVGDALDAIKARLGLGPAWRAKQMRAVSRPVPPQPAELPKRAVARRALRPEDEYPIPEEDAVLVEEPDLEPEPPPLPPPPVQVPRRSERPRTVAVVPQPHLSRSQQRMRELPPIGGEEPPYMRADPDRFASAQQVGRDGIVPMRPAGLAAPRAGVPDNLTRIRGIGARNEELLNSLGVFHFGQIAAWTPGEVRWIGQYLAFPERIERDDWVGQAIMLASGTDTGFVKSAERRRQRRREEQMERSARETAATRAPRIEVIDPIPEEPAAVDEAETHPGDTLAEQVREARRRPVEDDWSIDDFDEFAPEPAIDAEESPRRVDGDDPEADR